MIRTIRNLSYYFSCLAKSFSKLPKLVHFFLFYQHLINEELFSFNVFSYHFKNAFIFCRPSNINCKYTIFMVVIGTLFSHVVLNRICTSRKLHLMKFCAVCITNFEILCIYNCYRSLPRESSVVVALALVVVLNAWLFRLSV